MLHPNAFPEQITVKRLKASKSIVSDQQPRNPKLDNPGPRRGQPVAPSSGMNAPEGVDNDLFGLQGKPGDFREAPIASINAARVLQSVRMRWNPIKGLDFNRLQVNNDQWRYGFFRMAGMMWDAMRRRDYSIKINAPKREKAVARHGYDILTVPDVDYREQSLADQQQEFLAHFYTHLTCTTALNPDEQGGFNLLVRQMMEAHSFYYAVHETVWQPQEDGKLTALCIYCPIWWFEGTRGKLRYLDSEFQAYGREMQKRDWLVTCGDGLMEAIGTLFLIKWMPIKSWVSYLDKFGMPGLLGKTHAQQGTVEWQAMVDAVKTFAQDYAAVIGGCSGDLKENDLTLVEAKGTYGGQFSDLIEKVDRAITQLYRGGDLGTSSGENMSGASLQGDESSILEQDDSTLIEDTLKRQISRDALEWRFGHGCKQLAYLKLRTSPKDEHGTTTSSIQTITQLGGEIPKAWAYDSLGVPQPKPGEEVLAMQMPAMGGPEAPQEEQEQQGQGAENPQEPPEGNAGALDALAFEDAAPEFPNEFLNTFRDHKGRPGQRGGSQPKAFGHDVPEDWEEKEKLKGMAQTKFVPEAETKLGREEDKLEPEEFDYKPTRGGDKRKQVRIESSTNGYKLWDYYELSDEFPSPLPNGHNGIYMRHTEKDVLKVYDRDEHIDYTYVPNMRKLWRARRWGKHYAKDGSELPEHVGGVPGTMDARFPVYYSTDPKAKYKLYGIQTVEKSGKHITKPVVMYSKHHESLRDAGKEDMCQTLMAEWSAVYSANEQNLSGEDAEAAQAVKLIMHTGLRSGVGESDNFGCITLEGGHILPHESGAVRLKFVGKKGSDVDLLLKDKSLCGMLHKRKRESGGGKLFPELFKNKGQLGAYLKTLSKEEYVPKNLRTAFATRAAEHYVQSKGYTGEHRPRNNAEMAHMMAETLHHVAVKLGHSDTGGTAHKSYVQPFVWHDAMPEDSLPTKIPFHKKGTEFTEDYLAKRGTAIDFDYHPKSYPRPAKLPKGVYWPDDHLNVALWKLASRGGSADSIAQAVRGEKRWEKFSLPTVRSWVKVAAEDMRKAGLKPNIT